MEEFSFTPSRRLKTDCGGLPETGSAYKSASHGVACGPPWELGPRVGAPENPQAGNSQMENQKRLGHSTGAPKATRGPEEHTDVVEFH